MSADVIETPCVKVCVIDPASRLCAGCGRTIEEIGGWSSYSDETRARIMVELPRRMAASTPAPATAN